VHPLEQGVQEAAEEEHDPCYLQKQHDHPFEAVTESAYALSPAYGRQKKKPYTAYKGPAVKNGFTDPAIKAYESIEANKEPNWIEREEAKNRMKYHHWPKTERQKMMDKLKAKRSIMDYDIWGYLMADFRQHHAKTRLNFSLASQPPHYFP